MVYNEDVIEKSFLDAIQVTFPLDFQQEIVAIDVL